MIHFDDNPPNYALMEMEDWPQHIKDVVEESPIYMFGYCFLFERKDSKFFLKIFNINALNNVLWVEFKISKRKKAFILLGEIEDGITPEEKAEVYNLLKTNKSLFYDVLKEEIKKG